MHQIQTYKPTTQNRKYNSPLSKSESVIIKTSQAIRTIQSNPKHTITKYKHILLNKVSKSKPLNHQTTQQV